MVLLPSSSRTLMPALTMAMAFSCRWACRSPDTNCHWGWRHRVLVLTVGHYLGHRRGKGATPGGRVLLGPDWCLSAGRSITNRRGWLHRLGSRGCPTPPGLELWSFPCGYGPC